MKPNLLACLNKIPVYGLILKHVNGRPMLYLFLLFFQALTYRAGHHSTSDDSTKYRPAKEIDWWRSTRDPVARFRKWIERNGWWNDIAESDLRNSLRQQVNYMFSLKNPLDDTIYHLPDFRFNYIPWICNRRIKHSSFTYTIATAMEYSATWFTPT